MAEQQQRERWHVSRRRFVQYGAAAVASVAAGLGYRGGVSVAAAGGPPGQVWTLDLQYLWSMDLSDATQAASAYDQMQLVAAIQGIVNRDGPRLYVNFSGPNPNYGGNPDEFWWSYLREPGNLLHGVPVATIADLDDLITTFRWSLRGAVIWDPKVAATANVAGTVAGVEDLVPIRYDTGAGSVYSRYVTGQDGPHLPPQVWLVGRDGTPMFTGSGTIPGTGQTSTGSAKCDAYLWAKIGYLDTKRCDPGQLGYYLDGYWLTDPGIGGLPATVIADRDWLIGRRGFLFDLSPWADEAPADDPKQPLGTDVTTLQAILLSAYRGTGGGMTAIHGFVPWQYKYTNQSAPVAGSHGAVAAEWETVQIATGYNCYLDADAPSLGDMANASVYQHVPTPGPYPQPPAPTLSDLVARGYANQDGSVVPKRYLMFYCGDFDSAAWIYNTIPGLWNDPNRGSVPLNWAFNPQLSERIAPAFLYTRATRSAQDSFIAGDSGAGYLNPSGLETPRASGLPSGLDAWQAHCSQWFGLWDLDITGFVIDGNMPAMSETAREVYGQFSSAGFAEQNAPTLGITGQTPYLQMPSGFGGSTAASSAQNIVGMLAGDTTRAPLAPEWHSLRATLETPTYYMQVAAQVQSDAPNGEVVFLDAPTFYALMRQYLEGQVIPALEGPYAPVLVGTPTSITLQLTNYAGTSVSGTVGLQAPSGWTSSPSSASFQLAAGATGTVTIDLEAPAGTPLDQQNVVDAVVTAGGASRSYGFETITSSSTVQTADISVALGATNTDTGLSQIEFSGDGVTQAVTVGGESARETVQVVPGDLNMYFQLASGVAFDGNFQVAFTVDYYDSGTGTWTLEYDSNDTSATLDGAYTDAFSVTNGGTDTWKTATGTVTNALFDHRQNGGADFRIAGSAPVTIHQVSATVTGYGVNPGAA